MEVDNDITVYQKDNEVVKNNGFIRCSNNLTAVQRKSFAILLKITIDTIVDQKEQRYYEMPLSKYRKIMGYGSDYSTKQLRLQLKQLQLKELEWDIDKEGYGTSSSMLAGFELEKNSGLLKWAFSPFLVDKLLKDGYTPLKLSIILDFNSRYSLALYENLQMRKNIKRATFTLKEFRMLMGIIDDKQYTRMTNFKDKVLMPALKEINDRSDMKICYEDLRKSTKIIGFNFTWVNLTIDQIKERNKQKEKEESYREGLKERIGKKLKIGNKNYTLTKDGLIYRRKIIFDIIDSYEMIKKWKEEGLIE